MPWEIQDDIIRKEVEIQEESLLLGIEHKEMLRWREKGVRDLDKVDFLK
jgi:hypothetical protein